MLHFHARRVSGGQKFTDTTYESLQALKSPIFFSQRLALHQNGVEFRQQFTGAIRTTLSASQKGVRRRPLSIVQSELLFFSSIVL